MASCKDSEALHMETRVVGRGRARWDDDFTNWLDEFDRRYFSGYFSDKKITVVIGVGDERFLKGKSTYAECEPADSRIVLNPAILRACTLGEVRDTLLHELLHLFVFYTYENGNKQYDDWSKVFIGWSRLLNCPIGARHLLTVPLDKISTKRFRICGLCGALLKKTRCECGSTWSKTYETDDRKT